MKLPAKFCAALLLMTLSRAAEAHWCFAEASACQEFDTAAVVFAGRVETLAAPISIYDPAVLQDFLEKETLRVRFRVLQVWKGEAKAGFIEVKTALHSGGSTFRRGESYLVYAFSSEKGLYSSPCSRTRRLTEAGDDLAWLQVRTFLPGSGRIYGFVSSRLSDLPVPSAPGTTATFRTRATRPAAGATVVLTGEGLELAADTNAGGEYAFDGLPAGRYELRMTGGAAEDLALTLQPPQTVELRRGGCTERNLLLPLSKE